MVQIMITSRDICIVAYDEVVKIQIMTFWITSCDTCKHWTRSRRRRTQPSYFLSPWTCSGRQSHHRHISHSHHLLCHHNLYHCIMEIQFIVLVVSKQKLMFDFTRGLSETETTSGKRWLFPDVWTQRLSKIFEQDTWARCLNTEVELNKYFEQNTWTRCLNTETELNKIFEQNTWTRVAWLRCLNNVQIKVLYWEGKRTNGNDEETTNMIICVEFLEKTVT